ncbi:MAG: hypothetical protein AAF108_08240 [Planctomycetota bacterium]
MLTMANIIEQLIQSGNVWVLVPLGAFVIPVSAIVFESIAKLVRGKETEKSRREIAAYVAEGSITPDDGERLLNAGSKHGKSRRDRD